MPPLDSAVRNEHSEEAHDRRVVSDPNRHLIVDAMNVIGSRPNGWWRDRDAAIREFLHRLARYAAYDAVDITVAIDGRPLDDIPEGDHDGIEVLYARRPGRNAADDRIVEYIKSAPGATSLEVVTSDRDLAARARRLGAHVTGPQKLLEALDRIDQLPPASNTNP